MVACLTGGPLALGGIPAGGVKSSASALQPQRSEVRRTAARATCAPHRISSCLSPFCAVSLRSRADFLCYVCGYLIAVSLASFYNFEFSAQQLLRRKLLFKRADIDGQEDGSGVVATAPRPLR